MLLFCVGPGVLVLIAFHTMILEGFSSPFLCELPISASRTQDHFTDSIAEESRQKHHSAIFEGTESDFALLFKIFELKLLFQGLET